MGLESNSSITRTIFEIVFVIIIILPTFLLSRLTKIEHDDFYDQWKKDGEPSGMPFWFPSSNDMFSSGFRSYPWFVGTLWLFKTPEWTKKHKAANNLLRYYRIVSYLVYSGLISICLLTILSSPR
jgi:hypothetical protein